MGGKSQYPAPGKKRPFWKISVRDPPPAAPEYDGIAFYRFEVMIRIPPRAEMRPESRSCGRFRYNLLQRPENRRKNAAFGPQTYTTNRVYRVPEQLIRYGQTNTITVRVEDNAGAGGIVHGKLRLEFTSGQNKTAKSAYLPGQSIFEIFGTTPYYNEQW